MEATPGNGYHIGIPNPLKGWVLPRHSLSLLSSEQDVVAAWNVYISKGTSVEEDDQMAQNANAGYSSWSYTEDLPLMQDKKVLFEKKYKEYFMNNYLKQFTTNQLPTVQADAAVFDLAEAKKARAQKFLKDNELN